MKTSIEAIVFLSKERVKIEDLSKFFNISIEEMEKEIQSLIKEYSSRGINFCYEKNEVFLKTNPLNGKDIHEFFKSETKFKKLSKSSFEVLAIIAYKGPITKSQIEHIKGNKVDHIIPVLLEKELIKIVGKQKTLGNPNLYEITNEFLAYVGLKEKEQFLIERNKENENK